jgi:hypothetical protein
MKIIVIGPPKSGKSSYAKVLRNLHGVPTYCTDPLYTVKDPEPDVTYAPDLDWSDCSEYVARNWLSLPGPWCIEGVGAVRALRKYLTMNKPETLKGVRVRLLRPPADSDYKYSCMAKSITTIWRQIEPLLAGHMRVTQ